MSVKKAILSLVLVSLCGGALAQQRPSLPPQKAEPAGSNPFIREVPDIVGNTAGGASAPSAPVAAPVEPATQAPAGAAAYEIAGSTSDYAMLRIISGNTKRTLVVYNAMPVVLDGQEMLVRIVGATAYDRRVQFLSMDKKPRVLINVGSATVEPAARKADVSGTVHGGSTTTAAPTGK